MRRMKISYILYYDNKTKLLSIILKSYTCVIKLSYFTLLVLVTADAFIYNFVRTGITINTPFIFPSQYTLRDVKENLPFSCRLESLSQVLQWLFEKEIACKYMYLFALFRVMQVATLIVLNSNIFFPLRNKKL